MSVTHPHHCFGTVPGCAPCTWDEAGCIDDHHGAACDHPTCTDCGVFLDDVEDDCTNCGRKCAG
jgi:hypothetical protein